MALAFDPTRVKLQDIDDLEKGFGVKFGAVLKEAQAASRSGEFTLDDLSASTMMAFAFLAMRASGVEATPDSVREMTFQELEQHLGSIEVSQSRVDPTEGERSPES